MRFRGTRPLEVLLLPTELHPQTGPVWTGLVIARFPAQVKWYMAFSRGENASSSHRWNCSSSKQRLKSELDLARRVCIGGVQKAGGNARFGSKNIDSNGFIRLDELGRVADETVLRDLDALVVPVQQVEGLGHELQLYPVAGVDSVRILHTGGLPREQRVLPVIDGVREGIRPQVPEDGRRCGVSRYRRPKIP